eukprot:g16464.t1
MVGVDPDVVLLAVCICCLLLAYGRLMWVRSHTNWSKSGLVSLSLVTLG